MKLVIAEKPSVAMALAQVVSATARKDGYMEGNGYLVSWCVGHLVRLCDAADYDEKYRKWIYDDLPIIPVQWKKKALEGTRKQFEILKRLMHRTDVEEVICGTDAGREGELIFRFVYEQAECTKTVKRLWISSMEESSIREGFANLKDGSCYDDLYHSALCRAEADWLVGINASRLFSVLYNKNLKVGRVQTPTLAMIVDRDQKVKNFVKEHFYETHLRCGNLEAVSGKFSTEEEAHKLADLCRGKTCRITKDESETKTVHPPKLYDLTTLQRDANRILGYTAQDTLDAAQSLYESKLVTYPRTDSQYLTNDMEVTAEELVEMLEDIQDFLEPEDLESEPEVKQTLNSRKVSDHHAIIPTGQVKNGTINLIFHFCFPASTGFICQIFFIGSSRFRSRHRRGKIIVFANSITYPADFVVGAFIGNVFMVICKTGGIKDQMAMNMVLICMGCKHIFIFSFQNRISNFSADFVCKIGIGKLIGVKRNNHMPGKIVSFIHYIIFSHFCSHSKFQISSFGRASKGRDKQLIICLIRICNI